MAGGMVITMILHQMVRDQDLPPTPSVVQQPLPPAGYVAPNGVTFRGLDDQGYTQTDIPDSMTLRPNHDADGTPLHMASMM